jgi:heme exporter protein D
MIIVTMVALILFWVRAIIQHGEVYDDGANPELSRNARLDEAMRIAESMFTTSLLFTFLLAFILLSQILRILDRC